MNLGLELSGAIYNQSGQCTTKYDSSVWQFGWNNLQLAWESLRLFAYDCVGIMALQWFAFGLTLVTAGVGIVLVLLLVWCWYCVSVSVLWFGHDVGWFLYGVRVVWVWFCYGLTWELVLCCCGVAMSSLLWFYNGFAMIVLWCWYGFGMVLYGVC